MSGLQEAEKRARTNNAQFVAYMEKHRIYELFYEIATQLIIQKPDDHLAFMKQYLELAAKRLDHPRIILIAPPSFDRFALTNVLQEELGVRPITLKNLRKACSEQDVPCRCEESEDLAAAMRKILEGGTFHESGWLLVGKNVLQERVWHNKIKYHIKNFTLDCFICHIDLPRTKKEAQAFQRIGIIPTHVIHLIVSNECENWENVCTDTTCHHGCNTTNPVKDLQNRRYLKNLRGLREVYANCLTEVEVGIRSTDELGKDLAKLTKIRKHCGAPSLFRIALIGSRGSGCTTLAKYLSERFNLVHVDYDYIEQQARLQQNSLGHMLRLFECKWGERPKPEISIQIIENQISGYECLKRGWVLTGYPKTVEDFKLLDLSPTPPNRVIFVEVNGDTCRERLLNRRYNIVTGSKHNLSTIKYTDKTDCKLSVQPKDFRLNVERDVRACRFVATKLQEYEENVTNMMQYAGESAVKIDGNEEERIVREKVEACLMRPAPSAMSRVPRPPPEIDPMSIEFDPDAEPDATVFDNIRVPEPTYNFV